MGLIRAGVAMPTRVIDNSATAGVLSFFSSVRQMT